jgi:hypothetical protein
MYNKGIPQQMFQNQLNLASNKANVRGGQAAQTIAAGNQNAQAIGGVGSGLSKIALGYSNQQNQGTQGNSGTQNSSGFVDYNDDEDRNGRMA